MNNKETLEEIKKPIGAFIIDHATPTQGVDGAYYHYSEVCKLLRLQAERMYSEDDMKLAFEAGYKKGFSGYPNTENWAAPTFEDWFKQFKK